VKLVFGWVLNLVKWWVVMNDFLSVKRLVMVIEFELAPAWVMDCLFDNSKP
jgi:hypothetical protein